MTREKKLLQLEVSTQMRQYNEMLGEHEKTLQEQIALKRTLQEEKEINSKLLDKLQQVNYEKEILERIVEQQDIQNTLNSKEITRVSRKAVELQKRVVKEKCKQETLMNEMHYTNPAKLMNYLKAKKAKENSTFRSQAAYVTHVDAYAKKAF